MTPYFEKLIEGKLGTVVGLEVNDKTGVGAVEDW
jgi:hypothetical protein